jgi:hypothetical protein
VFGNHHLDVLDGVVPGEQDPLGPELQPPTLETDARGQDDTGRALIVPETSMACTPSAIAACNCSAVLTTPESGMEHA